VSERERWAVPVGPAVGPAPLRSVNPFTASEIVRYPQLSDAAVSDRLDRAVAAFGPWRERSFAERAEVLRAAARRLTSDAHRWAALMAAEMGKPVRQGEAEAQKCARACLYYAENAERFLSEEPVPTEALDSRVRYEPVGPVLAVMPWNFPFWQLFRFAAPALAAGNVVLLKHASNVSGCALALEEILADAGAPPGVFQTLLVEGARVEGIVRDPRVAAVTLTGGGAAGAQVGAAAGGAVKKMVLELGGSDAFVVLGDADVARAAETAVRARCQNAGQSCIAAKRFIVTDGVHEEFVRRLKEGMARVVVGDPLAPATELGPLALPELLGTLTHQVRGSVELGARVELGGERSTGPGFFFPPTVLTGVRPGMPAFEEETFGPLAAVVRARDDEEAVRLANATEFGLGASLWTRDLDRARRLVGRLESGLVFVNEMVISDPRLPFGGRKGSGIGRELGRLGLFEFVAAKTVWIGGAPQDPSPR
jgi:succinate-semialdehyde dehydrogenase/glutarate-semialdehyde dehydrogenase